LSDAHAAGGRKRFSNPKIIVSFFSFFFEEQKMENVQLASVSDSEAGVAYY
jgi:hypothetical protein